MIILERPNFPPYVCIQCGTGGGEHRKWFVSLNLPLDNYFNPVNEGNVFYCNECWDSLVRDVSKDVQLFLLGHEAYVGVPPTFENESQLLVGPVGNSTEDFNGPGTDNQFLQDSSGTTDDIDPSSVGSDSEPSDNPAVSEFLEHFGNTTQ